MPEHDSPSSASPSEIEALIARLEAGQLRAEDRRLIGRLLRLLLTLICVVEQKHTSISRLKRMLFGPGSDTRTLAIHGNASSSDAPSAEDGAVEPRASAASPPTEQARSSEGS